MIERTFQDIPDGKIKEADQQSFLVNLGWSQGSNWEELLLSQRILLISEAGAGKTYECRAQAERLWEAGKPAFYLELAALSTEDLRNLLDLDEESRFDAWLSSQSEVATFFLDSIDELQLTQGSFESALKKLKKSIANQLHRVKIVVTTRPIAFDKKLVHQILPLPDQRTSEANEDTFAQIAMGEHENHSFDKNESSPPESRTVALLPLSEQQIVEFSEGQGVEDSDLLLEDIIRRNAQDFARRPQDLIELCADWREQRRVRKHRDQVQANLRVKLLPREDRAEPADLSVDKAIEGASRLALAILLTRRMTIRHNASSDSDYGEAAIDPTVILSDWDQKERKALLERPLFGFASYGRVRFHHRSVAEYLAAERLSVLRKNGMSFRALKRLLFAETRGKTIVRPSRRPVASWLALKEDRIFELLRDNDPATLLNDGDPGSLSQGQRILAFRAYCNRYRNGGWRGQRVPRIQVHRMASAELSNEIHKIWRGGLENPEVREFLYEAIEAGRIRECADIVYQVAQDTSASIRERLNALDALIALYDERLADIAAAIATADNAWPEPEARGAILRLFPAAMQVEQFCQAIEWIKYDKQTVGDFWWQLPRIISSANLDTPSLEKLRDKLMELMSGGLKWRSQWPHITSNRPYLSSALAAACDRGLDHSWDERWLHASALALRLHHRDRGDDTPVKSLRERLINVSAEVNAQIFWITDAFLQSLHKVKNPWERFTEITSHGSSVQLWPDRDLNWIKVALGENPRDNGERHLLLEAALQLCPEETQWEEHVKDIKHLVSDDPTLLSKVEECLKPSKIAKRIRQMELEQEKLQKQRERRKAKIRGSWIQFWREVAKQPEDVFSPDRSFNTAWNFWKAMSHDGDDSRSSGWNRRFIEEHFGQETADKLRHVLMRVWRKEHPTLPSERPDDERNQFLIRWQLGLAAIYAESEHSGWEKELSHSEAETAARFALIELNGLPSWLEALAKSHPNAVDQTLGKELSWGLSRSPQVHEHTMLLQDLGSGPENVQKLFLPRLEAWIESVDCSDPANDVGMYRRLALVTKIILNCGDGSSIEKLKSTAIEKLGLQLPLAIRGIWMSVLLRIDLYTGVEVFEAQVETIQPSPRSEAVTLFATLFGDRDSAANASLGGFTPQVLLRLTRLAYRHVRVSDDVEHQGVYSPDERDDAERVRNDILTALFNSKGEDGLAAKLELSADPLCSHLKDRILAIADEVWAQEIDSDLFDEKQVVDLERKTEAPTISNEAMFSVLKDRLIEIDDLLVSDTSPLESWALIHEERIMRREIARELQNRANSIYTVDQEAVTGDEKETDIRLRSTASPHEAVIELKLADNRSARDLRDTIEDQLVRKYMAAENSRAGALLMTITKENKNWRHPEEKHLIDTQGLLTMLRAEAERVKQAQGGGIYLHVHLLDLRPRLPTEA